MVPRSVIVDLAAERGGNCELTRGGETIVEQVARVHLARVIGNSGGQIELPDNRYAMFEN